MELVVQRGVLPFELGFVLSLVVTGVHTVGYKSERLQTCACGPRLVTSIGGGRAHALTHRAQVTA